MKKTIISDSLTRLLFMNKGNTTQLISINEDNIIKLVSINEGRAIKGVDVSNNKVYKVDIINITNLEFIKIILDLNLKQSSP